MTLLMIALESATVVIVIGIAAGTSADTAGSEHSALLRLAPTPRRIEKSCVAVE